MVYCKKCNSETSENAKFCSVCGESLEGQKMVSRKVAEIREISEENKDKTGFWAKIIPGYRGYKKKELRRESDKLLRDYLVKMLSLSKNRLGEIQEDLAETSPSLLKASEDMLTELDIFLRKIKHADYGYTGVFDSFKIQSDELDRLMDFDQQTAEIVLDIDNAIQRLSNSIGEVSSDTIRSIRKMITTAINLYAQREDYMNGFSV